MKTSQKNLFEEFNEMRTNPKEYSSKIENYIKFIKPGTETKIPFVFEYENIPKISLQKGEVSFRSVITMLQTMEPLPPLEWMDQLCITVPEKSEDWTKKEVFNALIANKKKEILDSNVSENFGTHFDFASYIAEVSAVLQVVDDNVFNGPRRNNILSPKFKYVGISQGKDKKRVCAYITFC